MSTTLTAEHILALAPDSGSAQAGHGLAQLRKWERLGQSEYAVWGECQGSGKDLYRVQIDLREPAFRCSCPSRKFPCKHGIGLLLLLAAQPASFATNEPPPWVTEWLNKREQASTKRAEPPSDSTAATSKRTTTRAKSSASREANVSAGIAELERWMNDLIRQGLATAQSRTASNWESVAARLIDAQTPGLARMIRQLAGIPASGAGWQARLLRNMALIHLLVEGYKHRDRLAPDLLAELRTQIGWAQDQEQIRSNPGIHDTWVVLGQRMLEEEQLRVQRTWLWGIETERQAVILAFAAPGQSLDRSLVPGTLIDAELTFFRGTFPLRALVKERETPPQTMEAMPGYGSIRAAIAHYAAGLALNPWLETFPCPLQQVIPQHTPHGWSITDQEGVSLPIATADIQGWRMLGVSGGHPISLFGEWDGEQLHPLSAWAEGQFVRLGERQKRIAHSA